MRLYVYVMEARGLPAAVGVGAYAKLRVGKRKSRTRTVAGSIDPVWKEEFVFRVEDEQEELEVAVFRVQGGGGGGGGGGVELIGSVRVPVWTVLQDEGRQTLPPTWFSLERPKAKDCGKILLTLSLYERSNNSCLIYTYPPWQSISTIGQQEDTATTPPGILRDTDPSNTRSMDNSMPVVERAEATEPLYSPRVDRIVSKNEDTLADVSENNDSSEVSGTLSAEDNISDGAFADISFEEAIGILQSKDETDMPENLKGGILIEQTYLVEPKDMNYFLFGPNSQFRKDLAEQQGNTDYQEGPWRWGFEDIQCLKRLVTYTRAATRVVKAVKAIEEQTYLKANGKNFAVLVCVSTPEVPYGSCFQVELLYKIMPGPELSSGDECTHLVISWNINFSQSTVMKGVIEGTARRGLEESYDRFADLLAEYIKPVTLSESLHEKDQLLASLQLEHQSDWELAIEYFGNWMVAFTIFVGLYVLLHIILSGPRIIQGLEFSGLDLPDSFGELITSGILVLLGERFLNMISHFVQARLQRGSDHGIKAHGDGWLLTVALVEGSNLPSSNSSGSADPYVVFSSNGKARTSSVQLQTLDPQWNEILEFDAMPEPPSVLDVEVFDFDGPFGLDVSLGHAEINFLRYTPSELADMWVSLEGKLAQACQSKLHIRVFLENTKGTESIRDYLTKMEKEVGKKLNVRSPHRNSTFQKLFGLPSDEFLIKDFSCYLKRKMPLQGRLFLSARIVGFYANLFGHKTKFFFLWEDIEDIRVLPPSVATVGSPALLIILRSGRGLDARHGAKSQDEEGRLRFQFQAFVSFNAARRIIMALWRTKTLTSEQDAMEEGQQDETCQSGQIENTLLSIEDSSLSKALSVEFSVPMELVLELFGGGKQEKKIMEKAGCLNYSASEWEAVRPNVDQRRIRYKFNRLASIFGSEVTSTQSKIPNVNGNGWIVDEVMTLHNVLFGDHFRVYVRYNFESSNSACQCNVFIGIRWMKSTKFQQRISKNVYEKLARRWKDIFELAERDFSAMKHEHVT